MEIAYRQTTCYRETKVKRVLHPHTLFGGGQHHGTTNCDMCGKYIVRNSGQQKSCGPFWDKSSCAYRKTLAIKKQEYAMKRYTGKKKKVKHIKNRTGGPSTVFECRCGNRYIITREDQTKCLRCVMGGVEIKK